MTNRIRALIVDDENPCIETLEWDINEYCPGLQIVGRCRNGKEALELIPEVNPELVFLDIEMPGMNGFELLSQLESRSFHVIFTTAYNQYAIDAFKANALDYLLKPIDKDELINAVKKLENKRSNSDSVIVQSLLDQMTNIMGVTNGKRTPSSVALPSGDGYDFVNIDDIVHCQSESNYTNFYLTNGNRIFISKTLKEVEHLLPKPKFIRVHKSHLVNTEHIKKYIRGQGGEIILTNGQSVAVSRSRKDAVLNWIDPIRIHRE